MTPTLDPSRTLRGAACGVVAAAVWALQQPLDKLVFRSGYDDVELLGRAVWRGPGWYPAGLALHIQNGAAFGAVYANIAPLIPLPPIARGPVVALTENLVAWPLTVSTGRVHPARDELPKLSGNRRAFAQASWRHLLFGVVLGELDRRLNAKPPPVVPVPQADYSSNGRGSLEHAVSVEPTP